MGVVRRIAFAITERFVHSIRYSDKDSIVNLFLHSICLDQLCSSRSSQC